MSAIRLQDFGQRHGTVYGALLNTRTSLEAMGAALYAPPYKAPPSAPILYVKTPNTLLPGGGTVDIPAGVEALEAAPAFAVVIGRSATRVAEAEALGHVAGVAAAVDVTIPHASVYRPPVKERCRDGFLPIGTELAAHAAPLAFSLNGGEPRRFSPDELVRSIARLIADVTEFMTLAEGDVLLAGLAPDAPLVRAGDRLTVLLDGAAPLQVDFR